jgi:hypothetical protein
MIDPDQWTMEAIEKLSRYNWQMSLSIRPRVDNCTGDPIPMFTYAYKGRRTIHGPGDPVHLTRWVTSETYLFEKIKGNL